MNARDVILTAIHFKGTEKVRKESKKLAEDALCSQGYVLNIVRQVEKGQLTIASK